MDEDPLVVHAAAGNARALIRDIFKNRGRNLLDTINDAGMFSIVRDGLDGVLPDELMPYFTALCEANTSLVEYFRSNPNLSVHEVHLRTDNRYRAEHIRVSNRVINLLKHAERDEGALIEENRIDNHSLILECIAGYVTLMPAPQDYPIEFAAFTAYDKFMNDPAFSRDEFWVEPFIGYLDEMDPAVAKKASYLMLRGADFSVTMGQALNALLSQE
ncbi:MAG TPA: hypothetical protein PLR07_10300 [Promineifilum sp.]|nr:hypothetical protein [Promineifilum sp.]